MTAADLAVAAVTLLFGTTIVAPLAWARIDKWRHDRAELQRCGGVVRPISRAPRFTRDDPSPRPRDAA